MLSRLLHPLLSLGGWEAYLLVGALCFGEAAFLLGFVVPGETAVVLGGVLAERGHVSLTVMVVLVVGCAIVGDSVGYEVGRRYGPALLRMRRMQRPNVDRARRFVNRRGSVAVFLGRFVAVFRSVVPGIAGMSEVSYPRFLLANAAGGTIWGVGYCLAGYLLGSAYERAIKGASIVSYVVVAAVLAFAVGFVARRRWRDRTAIVSYRMGLRDTDAGAVDRGERARQGVLGCEEDLTGSRVDAACEEDLTGSRVDVACEEPSSNPD